MVFGGTLLFNYFIKKNINDFKTQTIGNKSWYDVCSKQRSGEIKEAISIANELIELTPNYPEGHTRLGHLYIISGDLPKSKEHFEKAYNLFPSNENKENLDAIIKRINN